MNAQASAEKIARKAAMGAAGMSTFLLVLAIGFGLRGWQLFAALSLLMAIAGAVMAFYSYRRYIRIRDARWQHELAEGEARLGEALNKVGTGTSVDVDKPEEKPLARP